MAGTGNNVLGCIDWDQASATNERVLLRAPKANQTRVVRNEFVRIEEAGPRGSGFLGCIVAGPFFPEGLEQGTANDDILAEVEIHGELIDGRAYDTNSRPGPGAIVVPLAPAEVNTLLGFSGDMLLGTMLGRDDLQVSLQSRNKAVLPRNVGIFGTVGSGKSNTTQVLIEEAAACKWAVVVLDVESEYVDMDAPTNEEHLLAKLATFGKSSVGLPDFHVYYPASCSSERQDSESFTLRLADFETTVITELLQTTLAERNALLDCVEYYEQRAKTKVATSEAEGLRGLLDASPQAKLPYTLKSLRERAMERASRSTEFMDYQGLSTKLMWLVNSGAFDQINMKGLDLATMLQPGRVNIIDVSAANDIVKNLVTADLLRKTFAYKINKTDAPPSLLVIEEAHSFISRERAQTMQATMQMLRNVTRRGRKRWLSMAFVSQQPGHLPPEIFELCNTRLVHTLRSTHNLEVMMATTGDVTRELWARCPLLGTGEAILSSPQLKRAVILNIRPASSRRKFVS